MATGVRGNKEVYALYGVESTHGTAVSAATSCGYVTSASVKFGNKSKIYDGLGDQQVARYGGIEASADVKFLGQDAQKTFAALAYRSVGVLGSNSLEVGSTDFGMKLVGAKADGITYDWGFDKPLEMSIPWKGIYAVNTAGGTMATLAGEFADWLLCVVTGGLAALKPVQGSLQMSNGCVVSDPHLGSKTTGQVRRSDAVKEGNGDSGGNIELLLPYAVDPGGDSPTLLTTTLTFTFTSTPTTTWVVALASANDDGGDESVEAGDGIHTYKRDLKARRTALSQT